MRFHDSTGRRIRPGDSVIHEGGTDTVLALWYDRDTGTDVTLHRRPSEYAPLVRARGSELTITNPPRRKA